MLRCRGLPIASFLLLLLLSCSGQEQEQENQEQTGPDFPDDGCFYGPKTEAFQLGAWSLFADPEQGHWWVRTESGAAVLESPHSCPGGDSSSDVPLARFGKGLPAQEFSFGSLRVELEGENTSMSWVELRAFEVDAGDAEIHLRFGEEKSLRFSLHNQRDLYLELSGQREAKEAGEISFRCKPEEAFFGLGTQVTGMNLRGRTYPLFTQEQGNGKSDDPRWPLENYMEAAYAPMGVWHSSKGYSALVGHDGYHEVDLCSQEDILRLRAYPDLPGVLLIQGDTPKDRMTGLTEYTGRLDVAPDWVFAPWNDAVSGPERLWEMANLLRDNDIPSSAIWSEDWIGGEITATGFRLSYRWQWDPQTYPDLPADIEELQRRGFAFLAYFNPFVPTTVPRYSEARDQGYLITNENDQVYLFRDPAFRQATLVDLFNEEAWNWTKEFMVQAIEELNIDGWMADFAEWLPLDAKIGNGESPWRFHNLYPVEWQRVNRAAFEEVRGNENWTFFARSGWASAKGGTPGVAPTLWGGDQNTDWGYDDGLPSIVPIGAHAGMAGVAIFGSDIAGYSSLAKPNTNKELFLRWAAIGAFHPLMRTHHGGDKCNNWMLESDAETMAAYRRLAKIHTRLLPYFRELREEAQTLGLPMIRHPYLVEGDVPALWTGEEYQFFLGDDLLVAPVLKEGVTRRPVELPPGQWWSLFSMERHPGQESVEVEAQIGDIPVFVRGGTALPLLGFAVDSFYGASAEGVTDLDDVEGIYTVALFPDEAGQVPSRQVGSQTLSLVDYTDPGPFSAVELNGVPLPDCQSVSSTETCVDGDLLIFREQEGTVTSNGATLSISGTSAQELRIGIGSSALGALATAIEITDLDPPFESYCERLGVE